MASQTVNQGGNPWTFAAGGATALPITICNYDFIPKAIRWVGTTSTAAGDIVIVTDKSGREEFRSIANGVNFIDERRPRGNDVWVGGGILTRMDSGELYLFY